MVSASNRNIDKKLGWPGVGAVYQNKAGRLGLSTANIFAAAINRSNINNKNCFMCH
jgi:hypothetical protein